MNSKVKVLLQKQEAEKDTVFESVIKEIRFSNWQKKVASHIRKRMRQGYDFLSSVRS